MNPLIGPPIPIVDDVQYVEGVPDPDMAEPRGGDRTEYVVAALVIGALAVLVFFHVTGFRGVIATRVSVGGGSS